jgi:hypothetical protein
VVDAQEADINMDLEKETGVGSRELLLQTQEDSIRERMRHEIVLKKEEL